MSQVIAMEYIMDRHDEVGLRGAVSPGMTPRQDNQPSRLYRVERGGTLRRVVSEEERKSIEVIKSKPVGKLTGARPPALLVSSRLIPAPPLPAKELRLFVQGCAPDTLRNAFLDPEIRKLARGVFDFDPASLDTLSPER